MQFLKQFEGIIGALIGVFVGWFLQRLDKRGKVSLSFLNQDTDFYQSDGGGSYLTFARPENCSHGKLYFELVLCNMSTDYKVIKNLAVLLKSASSKTSKKLMYECDSSIVVNQQEQPAAVKFINIPPKHICEKRLEIFLNNKDLEEILNYDVTFELVGCKEYGLRKKLQKQIFKFEFAKEKVLDSKVHEN